MVRSHLPRLPHAGFRYKQQPDCLPGRFSHRRTTPPTGADLFSRAGLDMQAMHERNAHNFPLDLAAARATPVALVAPANGEAASGKLGKTEQRPMEPRCRGDFQERCRRSGPVQATFRKGNSSSVVVSSSGSLIQTTSGCRQQRTDRDHRLGWRSLACS